MRAPLPRSTRVRRTAARLALACSLSVAALGAVTATSAAGGARGPDVRAARLAPSGLVYSSASAQEIQAQPRPGSCRVRGSGLYELPDPRCDPGAVNPEVTQATISSTICRSGWTSSVRPPESVTEPEKLASLRAYGAGPAARYEYDHLVPLELGGAVNDPRNLWPEPDYPAPAGFYLNPKDRLESALRRRVCSGSMTLAAAQRLIALDWVTAYARYG